jgi:GNAT superfamily N-acetyltransferase
MGDEAANTFMLGNLLYFGVEDNRRMLRCGEYWGYFEDGIMLGTAAYYNNSQCMVYHTDESVVRQMAADIANFGVRLVLGADRCVRPVVPYLKGVGRIAPRSQLFMELSLDTPAFPRNLGYEYEDARSLADHRAVQDFIMRCMREGFGFNVSRSTVRRLLKEKTDRENYMLLKAGGKYVAQAHIQCRTPHFSQIGGVCTLPEERRRGYARDVVAHLMAAIEQDGGRKACLVVNDDNMVAKQLYESLGFRETGRLMLVDFL